MKSSILTICFLFSSLFIFAQTAAVDNDGANLTEINDTNWSFYSDDTNRTYFIDFEKINVNISDIIVKNSKGEVVLKEDVLDLPVNTIYELDFSEWGTGKYQVELRSFTSIIKKSISIP